jgi:hypothetical protein
MQSTAHRIPFSWTLLLISLAYFAVFSVGVCEQSFARDFFVREQTNLTLCYNPRSEIKNIGGTVDELLASTQQQQQVHEDNLHYAQQQQLRHIVSTGIASLFSGQASNSATQKLQPILTNQAVAPFLLILSLAASRHSSSSSPSGELAASAQ